MTLHITYLISHSSSLSCHVAIKGYFWAGCIINTKLPLCVDIIRRTSLRIPSWCPQTTRPTDSCFQGTSCENLIMYGGLYQNTRVVCIFITLVTTLVSCCTAAACCVYMQVASLKDQLSWYHYMLRSRLHDK